jgi:biopolymer transport protein ExbB
MLKHITNMLKGFIAMQGVARMRRGFVVLILLLLAPGMSYAWWNKEWKQRDQVTFNTSAQGVETKETLSDTVVAVRLHLGNFDFGTAKPDGSDLRFVAADDKTELKHFVERFDSANGLAVVWVKVPVLAAGSPSQFVWFYHGNPNAPDTGSSKAVYDGGTVAFNFSEADGIVRDGGPNGITPAAMQTVIEQAGLLGASVVFQGDGMTLPDAPALQRAAGAPHTVSLWLRPAAQAPSAVLYRHGDLVLALAAGVPELRSGKTVLVRGGQIKADGWQHLGFSFGNNRASLYLDGNEVGNAAAPLPALAGDVRIGEGFSGAVDALQISAATRSADWFRLAVRDQGLDSAFPTVAPEAEAEGGSNSYFGILVSNLTPDAWAVISILGIMFVIAVYVMVTKALMISRTDTANRKFLHRFRDAGSDSMAICREAGFADSSLFQLYEAGVRELRKRHNGDASASLSGASIDAIKASIDADLVRESHKLNAKMVLLTIAISGGPFLGLLGTVVGVMITFAAIAAAGDVNVNAIAPGIAAALLATVAGLSVAIPALFGYNYLASRIKNISADMQIFVDEFVTQMAERFGAR